jgi:hypothetical protein
LDCRRAFADGEQTFKGAADDAGAHGGLVKTEDSHFVRPFRLVSPQVLSDENSDAKTGIFGIFQNNFPDY